MAKGNKGRGKAFSAADLEILFQLLEERLPMGPDQWDLLAVEYNQKVHVPRDAESLRFKFKTLKNAKKPTGDPTCPEEVKRAKRIYREIERKMETVPMDDDNSEEEEGTSIFICSQFL